ncbi:MAG: mechanosensitive ion channel family protein [Lachnospiraceae bacterium]|nr:mechanosensitive ion channel family protein [Lachnospiraceae bacterium]
MSEDKAKNSKNSRYHKRAVRILTIICTGIVLFFIMLEVILTREARREQKLKHDRFFMTAISRLNSNEKEIDSLTDNFNANNLIMLNNQVKACSDSNYTSLEAMPREKQNELLSVSIGSMEDCEWFLFTDKNGDISLSADPGYNGTNLITDTDLGITAAQFSDLRDGKTDHIETANPAYADGADTGSKLFLYCKAIPGTFDGEGNKYIFLGFATDILDKAVERMSDLSVWLNGSTIGNNGFSLLIDRSLGTVKYGYIKGMDMTGADVSSLGIDDAVLKDGFTGSGKINGTRYFISSRGYSSGLIGQDDVILACIPSSDLYSGNFPVMLWNLSLLLIFLVLITAYSSFVRSEVLKSRKEQKRVRLFTFKGCDVYYSRTLGSRIIPVVIASAVLIFFSSLYIQSLMKLSSAFVGSVAVEEEISGNVEKSSALQDDFTAYYEMQSTSRAKLMSFIVALNGDEYLDFEGESDRVVTLGNIDANGGRDTVKDEYGNPVKVINNSRALNKLKDANFVKDIYLISDSGYTMATTSEFWNLSLGTDEEDPSHEFRDILDGRKDTVVQPGAADAEDGSYIIGCAFDYYTCLDGDGNTKYVKYADYMDQGETKGIKDGITRHRGLLRVELDDDDRKDVIESASPGFILSNTKISGEGFLIGFIYDEAGEDYRVFYSGLESMTGRYARDLGISDKAFSGSYNGFQRLGGRNYLQCFRSAGDYYIATAMPTDRLYGDSFSTAIFCAVFGFIMMFVISLYTLVFYDVDEKELLREENDPLAVFGMRRSSKNWMNLTPTQRFEIIIKDALVICVAVFLASIAYEAYRFGSNSAILYIVSGEWDRGVHIFSLSAAFVIIILTGILLKMFKHVICLIAAAFGSRVETLMHLATSLIEAATVMIVAFYCLYIMGIDATRLLASAGILSIVVGLGAQSLVSDLLAGIFIVMEGSVHVGDYIMINDVRGIVREIGLRTTRYEDINQNIRIVCNNEMKSFVNMSMKYSVVYYSIPVPYGEDYPMIRAILNVEFLQLYEDHRFLKSIPSCLGIEEFSDSSVDLRVKFMCEEKDRLDVQRFMHDQIMRIFNENDIKIPFNQLDVHYDYDIMAEKISDLRKMEG